MLARVGLTIISSVVFNIISMLKYNSLIITKDEKTLNVFFVCYLFTIAFYIVESFLI